MVGLCLLDEGGGLSSMFSIPVPIPFGFFCGCIPFLAREDAERGVSYLDQLLLWPVDQLPHFQGRHNAPGPIGGGGESRALFNSLAGWIMARMICCPDLFRMFAMGCRDDILSLRIVAGSSSILVSHGNLVCQDGR
jgi:hypothetical protein